MSDTVQKIYAIVGHEGFQKAEALEAIISAVRQEDETVRPMRFEGARAELADVLDSVRTFALLAGRQVVVVDDADAFISQNRENLERYCQSPSDAGTLILICQTMPSNTRLYKAIAKIGQVIKCEAPKGRDLPAWIAERARKKYGKRVDQQTAYVLRDLVGESLGQLDSELGKLALYVDDRTAITAADVEALVGEHREEKVFAVTDAMAAGRADQAIHHWQRVLATDRAATGRAIAGLAWGIRRLLDLKVRHESGEPAAALARRAFMPPDRLHQRLASVSVSGLQRQLSDLMRADLSVKSGLGKLDSAVERFILTHTKTNAAR